MWLLSVLLSVCLSVYLSVYLFICLFVYLSICLFVCLFICLSVYLSVCIFVCLFICLSMCMCVCLLLCIYSSRLTVLYSTIANHLFVPFVAYAINSVKNIRTKIIILYRFVLNYNICIYLYICKHFVCVK